ncbi:MAG: tetratricopeptide repeat protein [Trueperaceae bacterium]|nr:tetratricopeptide repeat protein [Trueperaceae bacterium]
MIKVQLLGMPRALLEPKSISFKADKRFQFLAYLAYKEDWVSRDELAYLFWPEIRNKDARHNLRQLLKRVRNLDWLKDLEVENQQIFWNVKTDLAQLKRAMKETRLELLFELYRGPLLASLETGEANEFHRWLSHEREYLFSKFRQTVLAYASSQPNPQQLLSKLLDYDPLDEEVVSLLLQKATTPSNKDEALSAYQRFRKFLRTELNLSPSSTTEQLAEQLEHQGTQLLTETTTYPLPRATNSFIGRDLELGEIVHLLGKEDCHLLTLTGLGGIGKSRIALEVAEKLNSHYQEGCVFVALESLETFEALPIALATTLKLPLSGHISPTGQLIAYLADKRMLLVLDNFEHLLEGAAFLAKLLQNCPYLKMLVTSRERLNLSEEWLLVIVGLAYPDQPISTDQASKYDALKLFYQRAIKVKPQFSLDRTNTEAIIKIAQLVDGSPLGLELSAAWIRVMPVKEIAREIEANIDFLAGASRNTKDRHQSLRATFNYSWQLLSQAEQLALCKLSVFRGGFTREAAAIVADVPVVLLAALLDKSLLRLGPDNRYDRHPLIYLYTQEKLVQLTTVEKSIKAKHANYFLYFLQSMRVKLRGESQKEALEALLYDLDNLKLAWIWTIEQGNATAIEHSLESLTIFLDDSGKFVEAMSLFDEVIQGFSGDTRDHFTVKGRALIQQSGMFQRLGQFVEATHRVEQAIALLRIAKDDDGLTMGLSKLASLLTQQGKPRQALAHFNEALLKAKRRKDKALIASTTGNLSMANIMLGNFAEAEQNLLETLALSKDLANNFNIIVCLIHLADIATEQKGAHESAKIYLEEALALAKERGIRNVLPDLYRALSSVYFTLGKSNKALSTTQEGITLARAMSDFSRLARLLGVRADILAEQGQLPEALANFKESLNLSHQNQDIDTTLSTLLLYANLVAVKEPARATSLLALIIKRSEEDEELRQRVKTQLTLLEKRLPREVFTTAYQQGETWVLENIIQVL